MKMSRRNTVAALAAMTLMAAGTTWALWSTDDTISTTVGELGSVGISLTQDGADASFASVASDVLSQELTLDDAIGMDGTDGIAHVLTVSGRADANFGLTYDFVAPTFPADTYFAHSEIRLFPLTATTIGEARTACTVANTPSTQPALTGIELIEPGDRSTTQATQFWCLTASYDGGASEHSRDFEVTAESDSGQVTDTDTWSGALVEQGGFTMTHEVTTP